MCLVEQLQNELEIRDEELEKADKRCSSEYSSGVGIIWPSVQVRREQTHGTASSSDSAAAGGTVAVGSTAARRTGA